LLFLAWFDSVAIGKYHNAIILALTATQKTSMNKTERLSIRLSKARMNKLRQYAANEDKTITQAVSDWIDRLRVNKDSLPLS
jgi:hypothetical protein